jgi:hypothetical protein
MLSMPQLFSIQRAWREKLRSIADRRRSTLNKVQRAREGIRGVQVHIKVPVGVLPREMDAVALVSVRTAVKIARTIVRIDKVVVSSFEIATVRIDGVVRL